MDSIRPEKPRKIRWIEPVWKVSSSRMLSYHNLVVPDRACKVRNHSFFVPLTEERFPSGFGMTVGCPGLRFSRAGGARFEVE